MPDRTTKVEVNAESGTFRAVVPVQSAREPPADTQIGVTPGTSEHDISIQDVPHEDAGPMSEPVERRKQQPQAVVNVQQPTSAGLTGKWGSVANMSAVGFVLVLCFLMYKDGQANQKEFLNYAREESRTVRLENQTSASNTVAAITALATKIDGMISAATTLIASNNSAINAMVTEMQRARQEMASLVKILTEKKPPEGEKP